MKTINWNKIPNSKVVGKKNIWSRLASKFKSKSIPEPDWKNLEGLFCQPNSPHVKVSTPTSNGDSRRRESSEINFFDGKRSLTINIFLKQFKNCGQDLVDIVRAGEVGTLGAERLRGLLKLLPTTDEADMLSSFNGDVTKLGSAERLMASLIQVPSYRLRVEVMVLQEEFAANYDALKSSLLAMIYAADDLKNNENLHKVLYLTVSIGNFLNSGGYAGNAAGIRLSSLQTLVNVRANRPGLTLVHSIAELSVSQCPETAALADELDELETAARCTVEQVRSDSAQLSSSVNKVKNQLLKSSTPADLRQNVSGFIDGAIVDLQEITALLERVEVLRLELADFFCEEANTFKIESAFEIFWNFACMFKKAVAENQQRSLKEEELESRKRVRQQQELTKQKLTESNSAEANLSSLRRQENFDGGQSRRPNTLDLLQGQCLTSEDEALSAANSPCLSRRKMANSLGSDGGSANAVLITDSPGTVRRRISRAPSKEDDSLMLYLKSAESSAQRERRNTGPVDNYGSLDRSWIRRSRGSGSRRRPMDQLAADFGTGRERAVSPAAITPTQTEAGPENSIPPAKSAIRDLRKKVDSWLEEKGAEDQEKVQRQVRRQNVLRGGEEQDGEITRGGATSTTTKPLSTVDENLSTDVGRGSRYKRVYRDWRQGNERPSQSMEQKDILNVLEAIEESQGQQADSKMSRRKPYHDPSPMNHISSSEKSHSRAEDESRRDLIKGLGRKRTDDSLPIYVRRPSAANVGDTPDALNRRKSEVERRYDVETTGSRNQKGHQSKMNGGIHSETRAVHVKDQNRSRKVSPMYGSSGQQVDPLRSGSRVSPGGDKSDTTISQTTRTLTTAATTPMGATNSSTSSLPSNKIDIDAENVETPPIQRRALGSRSFRAPPNQTWLAAPRRADDLQLFANGANGSPRHVRRLRGTGATAMPLSGGGDSSEHEDAAGERLSRRYAQLVQMAACADREIEQHQQLQAARSVQPNSERSPSAANGSCGNHNGDDTVVFDRHSSVRRSTRRKKDSLTDTVSPISAPASMNQHHSMPETGPATPGSRRRKSLVSAPSSAIGTSGGADIERAIKSISRTAERLRHTDQTVGPSAVSSVKHSRAAASQSSGSKSLSLAGMSRPVRGQHSLNTAALAGSTAAGPPSVGPTSSATLPGRRSTAHRQTGALGNNLTSTAPATTTLAGSLRTLPSSGGVGTNRQHNYHSNSQLLHNSTGSLSSSLSLSKRSSDESARNSPRSSLRQKTTSGGRVTNLSSCGTGSVRRPFTTTANNNNNKISNNNNIHRSTVPSFMRPTSASVARHDLNDAKRKPVSRSIAPLKSRSTMR